MEEARTIQAADQGDSEVRATAEIVDSPPPLASATKALQTMVAGNKSPIFSDVPKAGDVIPGLIEGRIVHYTPPEYRGVQGADIFNRPPGSYIPAIVTRVCDTRGLVNLRLFLDGWNDSHSYGKTDLEVVSAVGYDSDGGPRTWRFPPRV